jgi:hypothetical protein
MTTVLFIHGTGVREHKYLSTFKRVKDGLHDVRPDLATASCYWGEIGAELRADGASFSFARAQRYGRQTGMSLDKAPISIGEKELARWARLYADPLFEIRLREIGNPPQKSVVVTTTLADRVRALSAMPEIAAELGSRGLTVAFERAVEFVTGSTAFVRVFGRVRAANQATCEMVARAVVAGCLAIASDEDGTELVGAERDRLVQSVTAGFGVSDLSISDPLGDFSKNLAFWAAAPWLETHRLTYIESVADVMFYQARGEAIRRFVKDRIREIDGSVVLLAHSLGGIVAFDLLAGPHTAELNQVRLLVTVGSQVPLLYELGALASGDTYPSGLPEGFAPAWVNVYDERDLLAYAGGELFGERCRDLRVDTGTPFPTAHGAYWGLPGLYRQIVDVMRGENL